MTLGTSIERSFFSLSIGDPSTALCATFYSSVAFAFNTIES
ncbi:hypothetical protein C4K04_4704 [Pseudomonas chlororaphis]|uniref:Uncharacterized protein n=1 Tax=Pseudomonas chlororaphis TaxID=587753 RepID=A0A3G7TVK5_9PSED|nr:hypothetical protein C4K04_4704 [Pseudomonas chlororaphis]